jgi:hypothetical protein
MKWGELSTLEKDLTQLFRIDLNQDHLVAHLGSSTTRKDPRITSLGVEEALRQHVDHAYTDVPSCTPSCAQQTNAREASSTWVFTAGKPNRSRRGIAATWDRARS